MRPSLRMLTSYRDILESITDDESVIKKCPKCKEFRPIADYMPNNWKRSINKKCRHCSNKR
jgi:hypothetical protein